LLDSDAEGERQRKRYVEKFGPLLTSRLATLADIDSTWKNMAFEEVLSQNCRVAICAGLVSSTAKARKAQFWRALQERVATQQILPLDDATNSAVTKIYNFLIELLSRNRRTI
jgi:hypothetical protein